MLNHPICSSLQDYPNLFKAGSRGEIAIRTENTSSTKLHGQSQYHLMNGSVHIQAADILQVVEPVSQEWHHK